MKNTFKHILIVLGYTVCFITAVSAFVGITIFLTAVQLVWSGVILFIIVLILLLVFIVGMYEELKSYSKKRKELKEDKIWKELEP